MAFGFFFFKAFHCRSSNSHKYDLLDEKKCDWIKIDLFRTHAVVAYGYRAIFINVNKGVTQGPILGLLVYPLFFKNDLVVKQYKHT